MADKYDEAIAYLRQNPRELWDAWQFCSTHVAGCLFTHAANACGETPAAAQGIGARPPHITQASIADLPMFADWERRIAAQVVR